MSAATPLSTSSTEPKPPVRLEVGYVARPHGLRGEVVVELVTNRPGRLEPGSVLHRAGGEDLLVIRATPHQHRFIVAFEGMGSIEDAEGLRGTALLADAAVGEDDDELFVHELIGCELVETSGRSHGVVAAVQANPASDLLVGEEGWLVPLHFVVSATAGRIVVDVPEGLFER